MAEAATGYRWKEVLQGSIVLKKMYNKPNRSQLKKGMFP